jgi:hypothetical protein
MLFDLRASKSEVVNRNRSTRNMSIRLRLYLVHTITSGNLSRSLQSSPSYRSPILEPSLSCPCMEDHDPLHATLYVLVKDSHDPSLARARSTLLPEDKHNTILADLGGHSKSQWLARTAPHHCCSHGRTIRSPPLVQS